jgi:hypothetical protein
MRRRESKRLTALSSYERAHSPLHRRQRRALVQFVERPILGIEIPRSCRCPCGEPISPGIFDKVTTAGRLRGHCLWRLFSTLMRDQHEEAGQRRLLNGFGAPNPQYVWDPLPLGTPTDAILRLDHLFPIGADPAAYRLESFRLSDEALALLDQWIHWLLTGTLPDSTLALIRTEFAKL